LLMVVVRHRRQDWVLDLLIDRLNLLHWLVVYSLTIHYFRTRSEAVQKEYKSSQNSNCELR